MTPLSPSQSYLEKRKSIILDLGFREAAFPSLQSYVDLLWFSNEELNLISRQMTMDDLIDNHVIDCLLPLSHFPKGVQVVGDFGSGGGLPAVIYAIHFPEIQFRLFEKSNLKREFLEKCRAIAPNLKIESDVPIQLKGVDLVTARGFKPLDVILDVSRFYFQNKGKYFLLKARLEKIEEEIQLVKKKFKTAQIEVLPLKSPVLEVERHLVLMQNKA